ncbi:MAG: hypothetical protein ACERJ2_07920 [Filomicrobium sp.]|jgi:hypothetical protein
MRTYLISYDLANPNAKKRAIAEIIMSTGERWARPLEQTWYVESHETAEEIEARMSWLLGDEDGLLVQATSHGSVLTNTSLRWFRQRGVATAERSKPKAAVEADAVANVVAFPAGDGAIAA